MNILHNAPKHPIIEGSALLVARNVKQARLAQNISQRDMSTRAGMSLRSYQSFEGTGEIHLMKFLEVLRALGRLSEFSNAVPVFRPQTPIEANRRAERRMRARPSKTLRASN